MSNRSRSGSIPASFPSAVVVLASLISSAAAQGLKLSGPLARPLGGDILAYKTSPDGARVVYSSDQETDGAFELFAAKSSGGSAVVKLASADVMGGVFGEFWIGPRSRHVVFVNNAGFGGFNELHRVPIDGGAVVKLSGPMVQGGDVSWAEGAVQIDVDETRVVYLADQDLNGVQELYSVAMDGGPAVKLNPPLDGARDVAAFRISGDGSCVVYLADQELDGEEQLFSVPLTGGPALRVSPPAALDVEEFVVDSRGRFAVFEARVEPFRRQLFAALLARSAPAIELLPAPVGQLEELRLSANDRHAVCLTGGNGTKQLVAARVVEAHGAETLYSLSVPDERFDTLEITRDNRFVLFVAGQNGGSFELFRAPIDGSSSAVVLDDALAGVGLQITPDGEFVVYGGFEGSAGLFRADIDGSGPPLRLAPHEYFAFPSLSADGKRVLYLGLEVLGTSTSYDLFSVLLDASASPTRLNAPLPFGGNVGRFVLGFEPFLASPVGDRVVYFADQDTDELFELFSVPADGSAPPQRINAAMPTGPVEGDVYLPVLSSDGAQAVYLADAHVDGQSELFSVRSDGRGSPVALHGPLAADEDVEDFVVAPDGASVVYQLVRATQNTRELRVVPIAGGASAQLIPEHASGVLGIDPTSTRVLFATFELGLSRLMSAPLDASAPAVLLAGPASSGFGTPLFTPDGLVACYAHDMDGDYASELFSVRVDGSAGPVRLDRADIPFGGVMSSVLTPDGGRVLYVADEVIDNVFELFVVPVDGSATPLRLNPALGAFRTVTAVRVAGDHAFYRSDQALDDRFEIHRVPLDGSTAPVRVNAPLVNRGNVVVFAPTSDGTRVVYQADQELDERFELYSAPADGSGPVVKLNGPLGGGDVNGTSFIDGFFDDVFAFSPDETHLVFRADPAVRGKVELFAVPIDGSAPAARVSAPSNDLLSVMSGYRFTPDGRSVVYRALSIDLDMALFRASLVSPGDVRRVSGIGALPMRRSGATFALTPDGRRLVYQLDQEAREVNELFLGFLTRPAAESAAPTRSVTVGR